MKYKENMLLGTIRNDKFSKKAEYMNKGQTTLKQTMIKNKLSESNHAIDKENNDVGGKHQDNE